MKSKTVAAATLGCKVNFYETEAMLEFMSSAGYTPVEFNEHADIYIINTCTVTNLGDKKSRQLIRRAISQNPEAIIAAVGCYVQADPQAVSKIEGVNLLIGTKDRSRIVEIIEKYVSENGIEEHVGKYSGKAEFENLRVSGLKGRTRAFIKVQDGCDRYCTYCIIPYVRGPVRSRDITDIIEEIRVTAANGYKEVVLTGIHVSSYGKDLRDTGLLPLLEAVSDVEGIERIRLSSLEPTVMTEDFVREASEIKKLCDHFHLSLQSGCDVTLARMNRGYDCAGYEAAVNMVKKYFPDAAITTDVIVGFPGESEADFEKSLKFCEKIAPAKIHVFPYSAKKGTKAASMPGQIPKSVKNERAKRLSKTSEYLRADFIKKYENMQMPVLFERKNGNNIYIGHTTNYIAVEAFSEINLCGKIAVATVGADDAVTHGEIEDL